MTMELSIDKRVAVVTGASKGMGLAIARALAAEGCQVCLAARTASTVEAAATAIHEETGAETMAVAGDVADPELAGSLVARVNERWGPVDILVNNAGGPPPGSFLDHSDAVWLETLQRNFMSVVRFTRAVAPAMKERRWGRILNITSTIAKEPSPAMVLSASARAAVSAFTKSVSTELAPHGVTFNTICPGGVQTERLMNLLTLSAEREGRPLKEVVARSVASIPAQRFAAPEEVADIALLLLSDRGAYLTGLSLMVDGGLTKSVF